MVEKMSTSEKFGNLMRVAHHDDAYQTLLEVMRAFEGEVRVQRHTKSGYLVMFDDMSAVFIKPPGNENRFEVAGLSFEVVSTILYNMVKDGTLSPEDLRQATDSETISNLIIDHMFEYVLNRQTEWERADKETLIAAP